MWKEIGKLESKKERKKGKKRERKEILFPNIRAYIHCASCEIPCRDRAYLYPQSYLDRHIPLKKNFDTIIVRVTDEIFSFLQLFICWRVSIKKAHNPSIIDRRTYSQEHLQSSITTKSYKTTKLNYHLSMIWNHSFFQHTDQ